MKSPNEQIKEFEKWYKVQWLKINLKYALIDFFSGKFKK